MSDIHDITEEQLEELIREAEFECRNRDLSMYGMYEIGWRDACEYIKELLREEYGEDAGS